MLKHFYRSGMDFLLHIFNLSWSLDFFPFIWKTSSINPIHMGKPLDSSAIFLCIFLTSCISKLFERIILSCLRFFLESNYILSFCQATFHPGWSTLGQLLFLFQSIPFIGFNIPKLGSRTIFASIDLSKNFNSHWHPALFYILISAGLLAFCVGWTHSFLSDKRDCMLVVTCLPSSLKLTQSGVGKLC